VAVRAPRRQQCRLAGIELRRRADMSVHVDDYCSAP
jgi:hypothetical protein